MIEKNEICIKARLVAKREDVYTVYVFKDLDKEGNYVMCTKCPNWNSNNIDMFQEGFLTYKFVRAGEDTWFNNDSGKFEAYSYTANYFLDFVPITHVVDANRIVNINEIIVT